MRVESAIRGNRILELAQSRLAAIGVYTLLLVGAEACLVYFGIVPGTILHAVLVAGLLLRSALSEPADVQPTSGAVDASWFAQLAPVLALISVLRLLSVVIPVQGVSQIYWYALIGLPLLVGVWLSARATGLTLKDMGLTLRWDPWQLAIGASGLPLGLIGYAIIGNESVIGEFNLMDFVVAALILVVFSGFLEELLFRGLVQRVVDNAIGYLCVPWVGAIFATMYLGTESAWFVLFMGAAGSFFGWCFRRTVNLWGIAVAHSIMVVGMLLVYPEALPTW